MSQPNLHPIAHVSELPPGERKIVQIGNRSIGVFNINGTYVAVLNLCPHAFAPICRGRLTGTTTGTMPGEYNWIHSGEILVCPWHGWEFHLLTGEALADRRRLQHFPVVVEDEMVYVEMMVRD